MNLNAINHTTHATAYATAASMGDVTLKAAVPVSARIARRSCMKLKMNSSPVMSLPIKNRSTESLKKAVSTVLLVCLRKIFRVFSKSCG